MATDKQDTVLRALVGDPHRHQPLAEHHEPASIATRANEPASMYTLETRYRPIPPKVLPQRTEPELFHIEPRKAEPLDPPRRENNHHDPVPSKPEGHPPVLYAVTGNPRHPPADDMKPRAMPTDASAGSAPPLLYAIVGSPRRSPAADNPSPKTAATPTEPPLLYSIIGSPRPYAPKPKAPQETPPPVLYAITGNPRPRLDANNPSPKTAATPTKPPLLYSIIGSPRPYAPKPKAPQETPPPVLYAITGNPRPRLGANNPSTKTAPLPTSQEPPLLYSIIGSPHPRAPVAAPPEVASPPVLYAVTGNPRQPPAGNPTAANAVKSTGQEPPLLYSIIGSPRPRIPVQEPPKVASSPVLYAVTGYPRAAPSMTNPTVEPIKKSVDQQPPLLYSVIGSPRRLPMVNSPIATPAVKSLGHEPPLLYSIVASPHPHVPAGSPTKEAAGPIMYSITSSPGSPPMDAQQNAAPAAKATGQEPPTLYALVANPRVKVQESPPASIAPSKDTPPCLYSIIAQPRLAAQPAPVAARPPSPPKVNAVPASPTLHAIVGGAKVPKIAAVPDAPHKAPMEPPATYAIVGAPHVPQKVQPSPAQQSKPSPPPVLYAAVSQPKVPTKMAPPAKAQPLQPLAKPTTYPLISNPTFPGMDVIHRQPRAHQRDRSPSGVSERTSRSLERKQTRQPMREALSLPPAKVHRQPKPREPTIPKSQTVFIPLRDEDRYPRGRQPRRDPRDFSPEHTYRDPYTIPHYDPFRLSNYRSPYAYHPHRNNGERNRMSHRLPPLTNNRPERRARPPFDDQRQLSDRHRSHDPLMHSSSDRPSAKGKQRSRLWDFEYRNSNDDYSLYETRLNYETQNYRRRRPRTPWIPVW